MINHFKTGWRFLRKNKATSFINIGGLAVGMGVAILIGLWVWDEVTYNHDNKNHDLVAEVWQNALMNGETSSWPLPMPRAGCCETIRQQLLQSGNDLLE
jgi:hypothetical protein